jgi:hypothetical protein
VGCSLDGVACITAAVLVVDPGVALTETSRSSTAMRSES